MKKASLILTIWAIPLLLLRLYMDLNDGFFPTALTKDVHEGRWKVENKEEITEILSQPFHYLGKGCQTFVFASQDDKYVIKFFKEKHLKTEVWHTQTQRERHLQRREKLFNGCLLAHLRLHKECGLVYMHIVADPVLPKFLTIYDKLGAEYRIDLERTAFYVQLKGSPIDHYSEQVEWLIKTREERGVKDRDPALLQNMVLVDNTPIIIDLGQLESIF